MCPLPNQSPHLSPQSGSCPVLKVSMVMECIQVLQAATNTQLHTPNTTVRNATESSKNDDTTAYNAGRGALMGINDKECFMVIGSETYLHAKHTDMDITQGRFYYWFVTNILEAKTVCLSIFRYKWT